MSSSSAVVLDILKMTIFGKRCLKLDSVHANVEEKEQIGIYEIVEKEKPNIQFGYTSQVTFEYDTVNKIVSETFDIFDHPLEDLKRIELCI